jgi:hypothetical protein
VEPSPAAAVRDDVDADIAFLRCHYRVGGDAPRVQARLDRVVRGGVQEALAEALGATLAGDDAVYILRRVEAHVTIGPGDLESDERLARSWAANLAEAIRRELDEGWRAARVVRFSGRAEQIARFCADLLADTAWDRWYHEGFRRLRSLPAGDAVLRALLDEREYLPAVLGRLSRDGVIDALVRALDDAKLGRLWVRGLGGRDAAAPIAAGNGTPRPPGARERSGDAALRPVFAAALRLAAELTDVRLERTACEALFSAYAARAVGAPDWRDGRALADAVADAVRFLAAEGCELGGVPTDRVRAALAPLDWLDRDRLEAAIRSPTGPPDPAGSRAAARSAPGSTPRRRELRRDLDAVVEEIMPTLELGPSATPANALRVYARLVARRPGWAGDPLAVAAIDNLLAAPRGPAAWPWREPEHAPPAIDCGCAGVFLLLRAIGDARLTASIDDAAFPPPGRLDPAAALLLALALRWSGDAGAPGGRLDPALRLLGGDGAPPTMRMLERLWPATAHDDEIRFQVAMLRALVRLRAIPTDALHLHRVDTGGAGALVAAAGTPPWCVFGGVLAGSVTPRSLVSAWLARWQEETGELPGSVACDPGLVREVRAAAGGVRVVAVDGEPVRATLRALEHGRVGRPGADLTLALAAVQLARLWARWLRGFSAASLPYLLASLIRRPGRVFIGDDELVVELQPRPLDVVLELAGYLAPLEQPLPVLRRRMRFEIGRTP